MRMFTQFLIVTFMMIIISDITSAESIKERLRRVQRQEEEQKARKTATNTTVNTVVSNPFTITNDVVKKEDEVDLKKKRFAQIIKNNQYMTSEQKQAEIKKVDQYYSNRQAGQITRSNIPNAADAIASGGMLRAFMDPKNINASKNLFERNEEDLENETKAWVKRMSDNSPEAEQRAIDQINNDTYIAEYHSEADIQAAIAKVHKVYEESRKQVIAPEKREKAEQFIAQTSINSNASSTLDRLSDALEAYARNHNGQYPTMWKQAFVPPFDWFKADMCGKALYGFEYTCQLREQGYELTARPKQTGKNIGTETYIWKTGQQRIRNK